MLIIANTLAPNGGTTFLIRMATYYQELNRRITVVVLYENSSEKHLSDLRKCADVLFIKDFTSIFFSNFSKSQLFPFIIQLKKREIKHLLDNENTIHVMGIFGFILAKKIQNIVPSLKITVGVYHQNEFMYNSIEGFFNRWIFDEISRLDYNHLIFFNNATRRTYGKYFKYSFLKSPVLPIGIPFKKESTASKEYTKQLIVSVGNLVGFKTYNKHIISLLPEIRKEYPDIQYHIYGQGEDRKKIEKLIKALNLSSYVFLKGILDYNKFDEIVSAANVFIGNGTAVLEAANQGVPSITGIESYELPVSYGFVSDIEGYDYNEYVVNKKVFEYKYLLYKLFQGGSVERERMGALCKASVRKFDISSTINGFDEINAMESREAVRLLSKIVLVRLFISFLLIGIMDILKIDCRFKNRRNQG
jgi:1,2-diacylglycerol 3-alpha-glucosyltransferase